MQPSDYIAILAVAISFAASWLAYRASMKSHETATKSHETSSYHAGTDLFMQLNMVFIEYPHSRPYFYDSKVLDPHDPNRDQVHAIAELMLDVFEWIWHRREGISEVDRQAWADYVGSMFALSPVLRAYHLDHLAWHPTITDLYFSQGEFAGTRLPGQQPSPEGA